MKVGIYILSNQCFMCNLVHLCFVKNRDVTIVRPNLLFLLSLMQLKVKKKTTKKTIM